MSRQKMREFKRRYSLPSFDSRSLNSLTTLSTVSQTRWSRWSFHSLSSGSLLSKSCSGLSGASIQSANGPVMTASGFPCRRATMMSKVPSGDRSRSGLSKRVMLRSQYSYRRRPDACGDASNWTLRAAHDARASIRSGLVLSSSRVRSICFNTRVADSINLTRAILSRCSRSLSAIFSRCSSSLFAFSSACASAAAVASREIFTLKKIVSPVTMPVTTTAASTSQNGKSQVTLPHSVGATIQHNLTSFCTGLSIWAGVN